MRDILRGLGQRIRELRIQRGFSSQEKFADHCGVHRTFMGHLETGRKDFRVTTLIKVAEALGVTLSELFEGLEAGQAAPIAKGGSEGSGKKLPAVQRNIERRVLEQVAALEQTTRALKEIARAPQKAPKAIAKK